jgi:elongation factor Ts
VDKIIEGQINKYFGEICLLEQAFVVDPDLKVNKLLEKTAKDVGAKIKLVDYVRFQLGEGLEKKQDDFAAEVAAMTK